MIHNQNFNFRFAGIQKLYGEEFFMKIQKSCVAVIGLGGVGSWAVEALARSGIGKLVLIDLDEICENNINRQSHALSETIGRFKGEVLKERIASINPWCEVTFVPDFFTPETADKLLSLQLDYVVDAIDGVSHKVLCLTECLKRNVPLIMTGASGGKKDPTQIEVNDLGKSFNDNLLFRVRKKLRRNFEQFKGKKKIGVDCIFSKEKYDDGIPCVLQNGEQDSEEDREAGIKLDCEQGLGSASFVTGIFGFMAASYVINALARN